MISGQGFSGIKLSLFKQVAIFSAIVDRFGPARRRTEQHQVRRHARLLDGIQDQGQVGQESQEGQTERGQGSVEIEA